MVKKIWKKKSESLSDVINNTGGANVFCEYFWWTHYILILFDLATVPGQLVCGLSMSNLSFPLFISINLQPFCSFLISCLLLYS